VQGTGVDQPRPERIDRQAGRHADRSYTTQVVLVLTAIGVSLAACSDNPVSLVDSTVVDIDGNVYDIVKIGDQWWMSKNLRTSRYRNGDDIPSGLDDVSWAHTESGAYAVYPHVVEPGVGSEDEVLGAYGALYNYLAVSDPRGLCPAGWRVPSDADWMQLEVHLGMPEEEAEQPFGRGTTEGGKLKATRTDPDPHPRWTAPNTGATDESGWSGLPGGYRWHDGVFGGLGGYGFWWSSTGFHSNEVGWDVAWFRSIQYNFGVVFRGSSHQASGFSVRCLKE
jgi:uncharacterized protein (TIGR02145 family)